MMFLCTPEASMHSHFLLSSFHYTLLIMPASRQLAAIMFADIAGYTAMMQEDEGRALQLKNKLLQTLGTETAAHIKKIRPVAI
jgi:class 3 adenylate cyclase